MARAVRDEGTPMHLQDRLYDGLLVALLADLRLLDKDLGPDCRTIQSVLDNIHAAYQGLPPSSLLRQNLIGHLKAFRDYYEEWNAAEQHAPGAASRFRHERIYFMNNTRRAIKQLIHAGQEVAELEIEPEFASKLYLQANPLRGLGPILPWVNKFLRRADKRFLNGNMTPAETKHKRFEPRRVFQLCVLKLCGKRFLRKHASAIDDWSQKQLSTMSQSLLRHFRAEFAKEFKLAFNRRPPRLDQLHDLLSRCDVIVAKLSSRR